ncbi:MAG: LacI family DNA-binding transcriptional regulator [Parasphingorhabdus sp.]
MADIEKRRGKPVTSYDVAKKAGVSQSAVSRCYKPGASVSAKTREKVRIAAEELGYEPNAIARSLITKRSNSVAVIIPNLTNLYYPEVLAQLGQRFSKRGIRVLLFALETESDAEDALQQIWQYQVDGVIAAAKLSEKQIAEFSRRKKPLVFYNRHSNDHSASAVCCDQAEGAETLATGLVESGHNSAAIICGPPDSVVGQEREQASEARLRELGMTDIVKIDGDFSYECGAAAIDKILDKHGNIPDAIMCVNDMSAIGVIDSLRFEHDLKVPDDVSVVGFDGVGPANWLSFDLSTVRQPVGRMTEAAVNMLIERIENPEIANEKRVFSGILMEGTSARLSG